MGADDKRVRNGQSANSLISIENQHYKRKRVRDSTISSR